MDSANNILRNVLSNMDIRKTKGNEVSCRVIQGKERLQDMIDGISKDLRNERPPSGYYDVTVEMVNCRRKLTDDEDDFLYQLTGLMMMDSKLFNIQNIDLLDYYNREKGAHMCSFQIIVSMFRDEKFRHRKYRKLLDALQMLEALL